MNRNVPFPSRGGDWRYDVKTGAMTDASTQPVEVAPPASESEASDTPPAKTPTSPRPKRTK